MRNLIFILTLMVAVSSTASRIVLQDKSIYDALNIQPFCGFPTAFGVTLCEKKVGRLRCVYENDDRKKEELYSCYFQ
jgi:hypothetical protein